MTPRKTKGLNSRTKWASDPMVPIAAENLRAAIELDGRRFAAIAREVTVVLAQQGRRFDENRQTLYALHRGGRRCRESRLRALAEVLGVPSAWLQGSAASLPLTGAFHAQRLCYTSPRVGLALWRLLHRCSGACARDLSRYAIETEEEDNGDLLRFEICNLLCWALAQLVSPVDRIRQFIKPTAVSQTPKERDEPLLALYPMPVNEEDCWLASIRLWESALEPWIANKQPLQYHALAVTASALYPIMRLQRPGSTPPRRIIDLENGNETLLTDPSAPFSLMPWSFANGE